MSRFITAALGAALVVAATGSAAAQGFPEPGSANPAGVAISAFYNFAKRNIVESAEKMPADQYGYQPVKDVRTFGQILGHVIDAQYLFCSSAKNVPNPNGKDLKVGEPSDTIEKTKTTKAELTAALNDMFAYCDPVFTGIVDAGLGESVTLVGNARPKSVPIQLGVVHLWEHYGNLTTYLRERGIVPPSTERNQRPPAPSSPAPAPNKPETPPAGQAKPAKPPRQGS